MLFMTHEHDGEDGHTRHESTVSEDVHLARAAQNGDSGAFSKLMRKYERLVYRTAFFAAGNTEDAEDLTQEIFLKMWHGLPSFQGNSRFLTWFLRIVRNACADHLRKKQRTVQTQPLLLSEEEQGDMPHREPEDLSADADPHAVYSRKERAAMVRDAMSQLSEEHRIMIVMRDMEGASYETIAAALGIEVGTVKSRLSRARAQLKALLSAQGIFD